MTKHAYYMTQRPFSIGAQLLEYANHGNGYVERWSYVRKEH